MTLTAKEKHVILTPNFQSERASEISCVDDYIKSAQNIVTSEKLLKGGTIELWRTGHIAGDTLSDFQKMRPAYTYGLSVRVNPANAFSTRGEFGWDGAAKAYVLFDFNNHLAVFYITHVNSTNYFSCFTASSHVSQHSPVFFWVCFLSKSFMLA